MTALAMLLLLMGDLPKGTQTIPNLSFSFYNPNTGQTIEPVDGWIVAPRDNAIRFHVLLEVESVEARYEGPIFRDTNGPDPMTVGNKRPQNLWLSVFRLDSAGKRTEVPIRTHCSGGGKNLRVYSSSISLVILYAEPERSQRFEVMIDRFLGASTLPRSNDPEMTAKTRAMLRKQFDEYGSDVPPGDYEIEAKYAPNMEGMWKGTLIGKAKIRVTEDNDPLTRKLDTKQDK